MTTEPTFVLAPGGYLGGWVWEEVADGLRAAGAGAHPVTFTGMGDRRHLTGPAVDLETHVEDLVQILDHLEGERVVLVGHCYGIFPAVGAADRRGARVERVVYLDAAFPLDGYSVLELLDEREPDSSRQAVMRGHAVEAEEGWRIPSPTAERWRGAATSDLDEAQLAWMVRRAAPQPLGTFTSRLHLTGAAAETPLTGVFCTRNGTSTAVAAELAATGDPRFAALTRPTSAFFDLDTAHFPMVSAPEALTEVLLRAGRGEGERLAEGVP